MLTASIVIHNTDPGLLIKSAECALRSVDFLYIVDNGSAAPDEALRSLEARWPGKILYKKVENRGFGAAHNEAIRRAAAAGSPRHLVLNPDVWWSPEDRPVEKLLSRMDSDPGIALIAPRLEYPDGTLQYTTRLLPTPIDVFGKRFLPRRLMRRRLRRYLLADADHRTVMPALYLQGSFMLFDTKAFTEAGGFDERFFMYPEDIDISRRLARSRKVVYDGEARAVHAHQAASRRSRRMLRIHIANMIRYFRKWGWLIDKERKAANSRLLKALPKAQIKEKGRG